MSVFCQDARRREQVLRTRGLNGIDFVEVLGAPGCGKDLAVTFLKNARHLGLSAANFAVKGDTVLTVTSMHAPSADDALTIRLELSGTGNFSQYTLAIITSDSNTDAPAGIDPQLASVAFSFKADCPSLTDCADADCCAVPLPKPPDIHYTARDYDGFRQAMLDRMAALVPTWRETHAADPGITLIETLAYTADRVSYLQDAVNTEAYLGTARSRISMRRHARLVDYRVQEGSNARTWICFTASKDDVKLPAGSQVFPFTPGFDTSVRPDSEAAERLQRSASPCFETMAEGTFFIQQNKMPFYTWGDSRCCLVPGTTDAVLDGVFDTLHAGDVLIFEEIAGPLTGEAADADPSRRWAVRLKEVSWVDQTGKQLNDPANGRKLTRISWLAEDALPFPLCISSVTDVSHGARVVTASVCRGNVVPADHGTWIINESLGTVPPASEAGVSADCTSSAAVQPLPRFQPTLSSLPLTFAITYDDSAPASAFLQAGTSAPTARVTLSSNDGLKWTPVYDLLEEGGESTTFVPEIEADGTVRLRFGDNVNGSAPAEGMEFIATYRVGNGSAANVGYDSLAHVLFEGDGISRLRNPIAASGGTDPESVEHIRQMAPFQFQQQLRCVTEEDYGLIATKLPGVAQARGSVRWTGSGYTAFVSARPTGSEPVSGELADSVVTSLDMLRMMGTDLEVEAARLVGLRIGLGICVSPGYFKGDVYSAVWKLLVTGDKARGVPGVLDAANFRFGQTVYASRIIAAAQSVMGVAAVTLTAFERMDAPTPPGSEIPVQIQMGRLELPLCDNDNNHADRGVLLLSLDGGK